MDENRDRVSWAKTYWVLVANQVFILGMLALLAMAMLGESYRACEAASLALPGFTEWYVSSVGSAGMAISGFVSIVVSLAGVGLRQRFAGVVVTSVSFIGCVAFLAAGIFSSIVPLLVAIRDSLPPDMQW